MRLQQKIAEYSRRCWNGVCTVILIIKNGLQLAYRKTADWIIAATQSTIQFFKFITLRQKISAFFLNLINSVRGFFSKIKASILAGYNKILHGVADLANKIKSPFMFSRKPKAAKIPKQPPEQKPQKERVSLGQSCKKYFEKYKKHFALRKNFRKLYAELMSTLESRIKDTWIELPISAWGNAREVIFSILLASFVINILALAFPLTLLQIYDRIIPNEALTTLTVMCLGVFVALLISAVMQVIRSYIGSWADAKFEHVMGCKAFSQLLNSDLMSYEQDGSGRHLKRISALAQLKNFYAGQAITSLVDLPFVVIFLFLIAYIGHLLIVVPLFIIGLYIYSTWSTSGVIVKFLKTRQDHDERRLNFLVETISKIHTIKSNTMEAQMLRRYERLQKSSSLFDYRITETSGFMLTNSMSLSQLTIVLVVALGGVLVFHGELTMGALAACTLLSGRALQPVNTLISVWNRLQLIQIAKDEFEKILKMEPESKPDLPVVKEVKGEIIFDKISLQYNPNSPFIFENLSLHIPANEAISISGEGLSGKSSLLWLILGMIKPTSGRILIDGTDIKNININSLREHIGYMPQNAALFQGTVLENLTMFDDNYVESAYKISEAVGLEEIVRSFPEGYDLKVGYQASDSIAVGIKQRIAIVRSIVRNPPIVLFDEANIALDMVGDKKIRELLSSMLGKHTIIIISHRPSILALANKHYVLENGTLRLVT